MHQVKKTVLLTLSYLYRFGRKLGKLKTSLCFPCSVGGVMGVVVAALLLGLVVFFLVKTEGRVLDRVRPEEVSWAQTAQRIQSISTSQWWPSIFRCVRNFGSKVQKRRQDLG